MRAAPDLAAAQALARLDALCARTVERTAPLRFGEIEDAAARAEAFRLRCRAVLEAGWGRPEDFPEGMERDAYDDVALHLAGWDGARLVATARLVLPAEGRRLPTEAAFDLVVEPRGEVVDFGRLVVEREYRRDGHRMLLAMLARSWLSIRARRLCQFCAVDSPAMVRLYRRAGFQIDVLGEARAYWGQERLPVRFDLVASEPVLTERYG